MHKENKRNWIELIKTYNQLPLLWNTKHKDYYNKRMREKAYEKLHAKYKTVIDSKASLIHLKKKLDNMRATYNRERKKVNITRKDGKNYVPNLWYYRYLSFLDDTLEKRQKNGYTLNFHRYNKIYLKKHPRKRIGIKLNGSSSQRFEDDNQVSPQLVNISSDDEPEENTENIQPSRPNRLVDLLHKQENFVATVSKMLTKKEDDCAVLGKAIGLQLCSLTPKQKKITQKLISDIIFYGSTDRLAVDSFVHVNERDRADNIDIDEQVLYVLPDSPSE